uniref:major capsid protein n=1 Tax=Trichocoleus desertorum TaxID=1481672 RepID=UPI0025B58CCF|nr:major capsid protein [Trichocoleus desertorum]
MAPTRIADILVPEIWTPFMQEQSREKSALFQSGIIRTSDELTDLAEGGGNTVNMPFFQDLNGDSEVLSDTSPLTVNKITSGKDVAVKHYRGKVWGSNDLAQALSGADPMAAIADLVAGWWGRDMQKTLISTLKGMFAATSMATTHVHSIAIEDGNAATSANKITAESTIDAFDKLGDETNALNAIAMHSKLYNSLLKQNLIEFVQFSEQGQQITQYLGRTVIIDDNMPRVAGTTSGFKYTSYLFGAGSVAFGEGDPKTPVETDRDSLQGEDYLVNRRHFILHPVGVKWQGNVTGASPTNAELSTGTNWARVYEPKNVKVVALVTNG